MQLSLKSTVQYCAAWLAQMLPPTLSGALAHIMSILRQAGLAQQAMQTHAFRWIQGAAQCWLRQWHVMHGAFLLATGVLWRTDWARRRTAGTASTARAWQLGSASPGIQAHPH